MTDRAPHSAGIDSLRNPRASLSGPGRVEKLEQQARRKRLILVSTLASFLAIFGLTVVQDQQTQGVAVASAAPAVVSNVPASTTAGSVFSGQTSSTISAPVSAAKPHARTRSS